MVCQNTACVSETKPENIIMTSFMAGLNEFRILNQSLVNLAGKHSGHSLAIYVEELETDELFNYDDPVIQFEKIIDKLTSLLSVSIKIEHRDNELEIVIDRKTCHICPHKFINQELKGTLCLFPSIIEEFVNYFWNYSIVLSREYNFPYLKSNEDMCIIRYKIYAHH